MPERRRENAAFFFSNHWKLYCAFFPIIGNYEMKFSNRWKFLKGVFPIVGNRIKTGNGIWS
jgi:hypothetical protein